MMRTTSLLLICLLAMPLAARGGMTHVDGELAYRHDENLSRAESSPDIFSDDAIDLGLGIHWSSMLTPNSGLRLSGNLRLVEQAQHDALSRTSLGVSARYRIQPVAGFTAPWVELSAGAEQLHFRDSEIRDGDMQNADIVLGKRFTDRIGGRIGLGREWRQADQTEVFEWQRTRWFVMADYRVNQDAVLYGSFTGDDGDQVFTATPSIAYKALAKAYTNDTAFGQRRAYRLDARAKTAEIGLHYTVNASNSLDFGIRRFRAEADGDHQYDNTELRLSWLVRFR